MLLLLLVAWPGGATRPRGPRGTVDRLACRKAPRGKLRSQRTRPSVKAAECARLRSRVVGGVGLRQGGGHASTVRPDPSTLGVVGERGSRRESCLQLVPGSAWWWLSSQPSLPSSPGYIHSSPSGSPRWSGSRTAAAGRTRRPTTARRPRSYRRWMPTPRRSKIQVRIPCRPGRSRLASRHWNVTATRSTGCTSPSATATPLGDGCAPPIRLRASVGNPAIVTSLCWRRVTGQFSARSVSHYTDYHDPNSWWCYG